MTRDNLSLRRFYSTANLRITLFLLFQA
jgi:hypothetical protein